MEAVTLPKFEGLIELFDYFKDEQTCKDFLEKQRWNGTPTCPHCGYKKAWRTNRGFTCAHQPCRKKFSVTVGTVMENTKISLRKWFGAIYLLTSHKKGISSCQLAKDLRIRQGTAWFLEHRIRLMLEEKEPIILEKEVQVDETYVGGKRHNMHGRKRQEIREKYGTTGSAEKLVVFGMLQTGGKLVTMHTPTNDGETLKPLIRKHVDSNATLITDQHGAYAGIGREYSHIVVNHGRKNYVAESGHHNNGIESAWAILKRGYIGIYHYMSPKHLYRYCNEFSYRFNTIKSTDGERFCNALLRVEGRLKYKDLIAA